MTDRDSQKRLFCSLASLSRGSQKSVMEHITQLSLKKLSTAKENLLRSFILLTLFNFDKAVPYHCDSNVARSS